MNRLARVVIALAGSALAFSVSANQPSVALAGVLGSKALLVIGTNQPRSLAVGQSYQGVTLISLSDGQALVEWGGQRRLLTLGGAPASVASVGTSSGKTRIVLSADALGHFMTRGQINGHSTMMMVDTGATSIALSVAHAKTFGLDYEKGTAQRISTANGTIGGWHVKIEQLRVGSAMFYDIDATVSDGAMPYVLLGNNFLGRFNMNRSNDQMVLEQRF